MSTATCVSCQDVLSCDDSPLSVTGSVIGILTFTSAFIISIQVYVNSMRNANLRMLEMVDTFRSRVDELQHLEYKLCKQRSRIGNHLGERLDIAMKRVKEPMEQAFALLYRLKNDSFDRKRRFWIRARFVLKENIVKEGLEKTEKAMETLREVANDISLEVASEPADHEVAFRSEILQELVEMRNEMKNLNEANAKLLHKVEELLRDSTS